jgi:Lysylphosphatidylglycerol synthase TM region
MDPLISFERIRMRPAQPNFLSRKHLSVFASFLLAGIIATIAFVKSDSVIASLKNIGVCWAVAGLGCYWINYLLRSMRFCTISENRLQLWPDAVKATCLHGLATYMLPFRAGDLTLPAILKSINNTSWIEGGRILIKSRILDVSSMGILMICAAALTQVRISFTLRLGWMGVGITMMISPLIISWLLSSGSKKSSLALRNIILKIETVSAIKRLEVIQSLGIWMAIGGCLFCAARAVGLSLGPGDAIFLISVQFPLQLIPIQGFANAGNHEGGWIAALTILGIPASSGLVFALASHALVFVYVVSLGVVSLLIRRHPTLHG